MKKFFIELVDEFGGAEELVAYLSTCERWKIYEERRNEMSGWKGDILDIKKRGSNYFVATSVYAPRKHPNGMELLYFNIEKREEERKFFEIAYHTIKFTYSKIEITSFGDKSLHFTFTYKLEEEPEEEYGVQWGGLTAPF